MDKSLNRDFDEVYQGLSSLGRRGPWDIGEPQPTVVQYAEAGLFDGHILDVGCGTGEHALYLAAMGKQVAGVDMSPTAIEMAKQKAQERGLEVSFEVRDVLHWNDERDLFDVVLDCAVLHLFEGPQRAAYVQALHRVCRKGANLFMMGFPPPPYAVARAVLAKSGARIALSEMMKSRLQSALAGRFELQSVNETTMKVYRPGTSGASHLEAWVATATRLGRGSYP